MIDRRRLLRLAAGASFAGFAAPARAETQPKRIAAVMLGLFHEDDRNYAALKEGLKRLGREDGKTAAILARWPGTGPQMIRRIANELIASHPDVILAASSPVLAEFHRLTTTIPTVFVVVSDPVGQGFVQTLAHPGGNATGFLNYEGGMASKWLGLLKEMAPEVARVGAIYNPDTAPQAPYFLDVLAKAAEAQALALRPAPVRDDAGIESEAAAMAAVPGGGLLVLPDIFFGQYRSHVPQVIEAAARHRLPAIYPYAEMAGIGGLIGYGVDVPDLFRRSADYIDRILKGEKPADLPVQAPSKFSLAINLKTAKTLGLAVPQRLLYTADEVIE